MILTLKGKGESMSRRRTLYFKIAVIGFFVLLEGCLLMFTRFMNILNRSWLPPFFFGTDLASSLAQKGIEYGETVVLLTALLQYKQKDYNKMLYFFAAFFIIPQRLLILLLNDFLYRSGAGVLWIIIGTTAGKILYIFLSMVILYGAFYKGSGPFFTRGTAEWKTFLPVAAVTVFLTILCCVKEWNDYIEFASGLVKQGAHAVSSSLVLKQRPFYSIVNQWILPFMARLSGVWLFIKKTAVVKT